MSCCTRIDGLPPGPGPGPGPSACENVLTVEASDPFATLPAPVGTVVTLPPDTYVEICGNVDIGANTLVLPASSVLGGKDPLVDGVTSTASTVIRMPDGGTLKDLSVEAPLELGEAVVIGADGGTWENAVVWNVNITAGNKTGIQILGGGEAIAISRARFLAVRRAIEIGRQEVQTSVGLVSVDMSVCEARPGVAATLLYLEASATVAALAVLQSIVLGANATDVGLEVLGQTGTVRFASLAFLGLGVPSVVAQPPPLPPATTGTAVQGEAVGCVGFDNSQQRGSAYIFGAVAPVPAPGVFVAPGTAGDSLTLDPSSVRVGLAGTNVTNQALVFQRVAPYQAEITVALSVQVAAGFSFFARAIAVQLLVNGIPTAQPFVATTPDLTVQSPAYLGASYPAQLQAGDTVAVRVANLTDAASIGIVNLRITIQ